MDKAQILEQIAVFPLISRVLSKDLRHGAYRSIFRGQGMEFQELRDYRAGDDIRSIDCNTSARFSRPYVKVHKEERDFPLCVLLDCSISMREQGGGAKSRFEQALLLFALLGFAAQNAGQTFGAVFFDNEVREVWRARGGRAHLFSMIDSAIALFGQKNAERGTALQEALRRTWGFRKKKGLLVVISDFLQENWGETDLAELSKVYDSICIKITLPMETNFTLKGGAFIEDMEGAKIVNAMGGASFSEAWEDYFKRITNNWQDACQRAGAVPLLVSTEDDAASVLMHFFGQRKIS